MTKIAPYAKETCPTCGVVFTASPYTKGNKATYYKTCPNGHEHSAYALRLAKGKAPAPAEEQAKPLIVSDFRAALELMVAAYEQAERTFPKGSLALAMLEGAFQNSVKVAREIVR